MSQDKRDKSNADRSSSAKTDDKKQSSGTQSSNKTSPHTGSSDRAKQTTPKQSDTAAGSASASAPAASTRPDQPENKASDKAQSEAGKASSEQPKQAGSQSPRGAGDRSAARSSDVRGADAAAKSGDSDKTKPSAPAGGVAGQASRADQSAARASADKSGGAGSSAKLAAGDESRKTAATSSTGTTKHKTTTGTTSAARSAASGSGGGGARPTSSGSGGGGRRSPGIGLIVAVVALILALIAAAATGYLWYQGQQRIADLDSRVNTVEKGMQHNVQKVVMPKLSDMHDRMGQFSQRVDRLSQALDQRQQQIKKLRQSIRHVRHQNTQLSDQLGGNHERFVEQRIALLLEAANQRLQIAHDPKGAAQALKLADQAIARSGDPELHPVRAQIANEMAALKALPNPDIEGLSLKLSNDIEQIPKLPLKTNVPSTYHSRPQPGDGSGAEQNDSSGSGSGEFAGIKLAKKWHQFLDSVGNALSRMVTIRRANGTENAPALMAPDQSFFLVQNLQLQLRSARLALLNGNAQTYQHALSGSRDWINKYFDTDDSAVSGVLDDLSELSHVKIDWQAPDLSGGLKTLHRIMDRNENGQGAGSDASSGGHSDTQSESDNAKKKAPANDDTGNAGSAESS